MQQFNSLRNRIEKLLISNKTTLLLVRHGETEANFTKQLSGWHDVKLTEKGIKEAQQLNNVFGPFRDKFAGIFSSDLSRAYITAQTVIGHSENIKATMQLRELNFGDHQNKIYSEENKSIYDILFTTQYQAPNGENWQQVKDRIMEYINQQINKQGVYVIFTHGGAIFSLTHQFGFTNTIKNCSCVAVEMTNSQISQLLFYWEYPKFTL